MCLQLLWRIFPHPSISCADRAIFYGAGKAAAAIIAAAATADSLARSVSFFLENTGIAGLGWGGDVVRVSRQPGAGILQYLCDACKI